MSAEIIPFNKERCCSFCNVPMSKTQHLWGGGNGKNVCGDCIRKMKEMIKEKNNVD